LLVDAFRYSAAYVNDNGYHSHLRLPILSGTQSGQPDTSELYMRCDIIYRFNSASRQCRALWAV